MATPSLFFKLDKCQDFSFYLLLKSITCLHKCIIFGYKSNIVTTCRIVCMIFFKSFFAVRNVQILAISRIVDYYQIVRGINIYRKSISERSKEVQKA